MTEPNPNPRLELIFHAEAEVTHEVTQGVADDRDRPSWEPKDLTEAIAAAVRKREAAKGGD